jgi:hypothetical protein
MVFAASPEPLAGSLAEVSRPKFTLSGKGAM